MRWLFMVLAQEAEGDHQGEGKEAFHGCTRLNHRPFEPVTPFRQRLDLAVGDAALEHPEAAVGVDELHAACAELFLGRFDAAGDFVGGFDVVHLDVHDAETDTDFGIEFLERVEISGGTMREFEHEVIGAQEFKNVMSAAHSPF
jgi:hypothetical protein